MHLRVRVTPNAAHSEILGWGDAPLGGRLLRVRIAAPATDGRANAALADFLAKSLGLPRSQVRLLKGASSRIKTFEVPEGTKVPKDEG